MNLQPRHIQILTILKNHKDGLSTADIFKISQTMAGNEIPANDGTGLVSKLVYTLRGGSLITTHDAGKTKIHKLSPLGHEALLKSDDEFEMPPAPVLPKKEITEVKPEITGDNGINAEKVEDNDCFILNRDGFYSPLFDMLNRFENLLAEKDKQRQESELKKGVFMLDEKLELLEEIASAKFIDEDRANYLRDIADDLRSAA